jgi:hypothetical protein
MKDSPLNKTLNKITQQVKCAVWNNKKFVSKLDADVRFLEGVVQDARRRKGQNQAVNLRN